MYRDTTFNCPETKCKMAERDDKDKVKEACGDQDETEHIWLQGRQGWGPRDQDRTDLKKSRGQRR